AVGELEADRGEPAHAHGDLVHPGREQETLPMPAVAVSLDRDLLLACRPAKREGVSRGIAPITSLPESHAGILSAVHIEDVKPHVGRLGEHEGHVIVALVGDLEGDVEPGGGSVIRARRDLPAVPPEETARAVALAHGLTLEELVVATAEI